MINISKKINGEVFTPKKIIKKIFKLINYSGEKILYKKIIDNSCGDGNFLMEIIKKYCYEYKKKYKNYNNVKFYLEKYIYGIEINYNNYTACLNRLNIYLRKIGINEKINWKIYNFDTIIHYKKFNNFDYIVGNPPYVRIQNLLKNNKNKFNSNFFKGNIDLYLWFFEISFKMLKNNGKIGLITPNSYLKNKSSINFRKYLILNKKIKYIYNFNHMQKFKNVITYTCISIFENNKNNFFKYLEDGITTKINFKDIKKISDYKVIKFDENIYKILLSKPKKYFSVKNGFATLNDKFFIKEKYIENITIPVIKASTMSEKWILFPYNYDGKVNEKIFEMIKEKFKTNDILFGRTQGLKDVNKNKIAINNIWKNKLSIKYKEIKNICGIYSGLYIVKNIEYENISMKNIKYIIISDEFENYFKNLGTHKSGGYYTLSSSMIELFLNYKIERLIN